MPSFVRATAISAAAALSACALPPHPAPCRGDLGLAETVARSVAASAPASPAQATAASQPREREARRWRNGFEVGYRSVELAEITSDAVGTVGGSTFTVEIDIPDVEREELRFGYRGGTESASLVVNFIVERDFLDIYDLLGGEIGIEGTPRLMPRHEVSPTLDYSVALSGRAGDGEIPVIVGGSAAGTTEADIIYGELWGQVGVGADWRGLQAAAGVVSSVLYGNVGVDATSVGLGDEDLRFHGINVGGYVEAGYAAVDLPVAVSVTVFFGDVSGFALTGGVRF